MPIAILPLASVLSVENFCPISAHRPSVLRIIAKTTLGVGFSLFLGGISVVRLNPFWREFIYLPATHVFSIFTTSRTPMKIATSARYFCTPIAFYLRLVLWRRGHQSRNKGFAVSPSSCWRELLPRFLFGTRGNRTSSASSGSRNCRRGDSLICSGGWASRRNAG